MNSSAAPAPLSSTPSVLDYFPLPSARPTQKILLEEIVKVFESGKKIIVLEAPVGSGKSAIAVALARYFKQAHILTPRKGLQDQYFEDFSSHLSLMMGRSAYPCVFESTHAQRTPIYAAIKEGRTPYYPIYSESCATAPCVHSEKIYSLCTSDKECPYTLAMTVAQQDDIIVHNLHSFLFQTNYGEKFGLRPLLIVDEAHEIENTIRDFSTGEMSFRPHIQDPVNHWGIEAVSDTFTEWQDFFLQDGIAPVETQRDRDRKETDPDYVSPRDQFFTQMEMALRRFENKPFSTEVTLPTRSMPSYKVRFIPHSVGNDPNGYIFQFGERVLLMSGTIYNFEQYCKSLGINSNDAHFIRINSSFPVSNRPIYAKPQYQVDTSHAKWRDNLPEAIRICDLIMTKFGDVKGLIHAPSYITAREMIEEMTSSYPESAARLVTHTSGDFAQALERFYASKAPGVFISPICQQGVDFKDDRARFQIITRVPYAATGGRFMSHQVKNNFSWYNYQALVTWGQQIGRVNRSEADFGATFLLDSRFANFLSKNRQVIPKWVLDAVIWK